MKIYKCEECNLEFKNFQTKANHDRWHHKKIKFSEKGLQAIKSGFIKINQNRSLKRFGNLRGKSYSQIIKCLKCGNDFERIVFENRESEGRINCIDCQRKRILSPEACKKISIGIKNAWKNGAYDNNFRAPNKRFTSKGEVDLRSWFIENFPEEEWTFGGCVLQNDIRYSRDLFSNKLKIAIEYDGIWHFKDIHGQLKNKQEKDAAFNEWIIVNNWKLIRISEEVYQQKPLYWKHFIHDLCKNPNVQGVNFLY